MSSFYRCVPKISILWCTVPEIRSDPENQNFEKMEKLPGIPGISFYACEPKINIIWCMIPEIQGATYRIFGHFGSFFALSPPSSRPCPPPPPWGIIISQICTINDNGMWNVWNVWFPEIWSTMHRTFCHFGLYFCPFTLPTHSPANYPENQNFEKMKKTPGDLSFYECVP